GIFTWFNPVWGQPHDVGFDLAFKEVELADEWGWDCIWLPENHFSAYTLLASSPFVLATAILGRTKQIRCALAIQQLRLNADGGIIFGGVSADKLFGAE